MALPGVKELTDYLGLEVSIAFETDGCITSFALEMKANIIQWIPGLGQIAAAVNKTKLGKVKAGLVGSGKASVCKSKPRVVGDANSTNIVFRDGEVALGIFVTLGIGAGT